MSTSDEERRHREAVAALDAAVQRAGVRQLVQLERLAGDVLTQAAEVFGSRETAADWLMRPAMALDRQRPVDLLGTAAGKEQVELLLIRLQYGVYT
ncbi:antitoxin Xre/MbcA/ParS toxin-binding domain-containing protein [Muricoccus aerilatus]|uniref:antitoxin Xre/MbcA/ParS toxin-binding domain-containing protein n=1 Tax=Muricoccus aerilatus TaxID=452982 RepID=UPI000A8789AA|nr:antitoxin Xre/MbcA/ParS toxin-binding domain-containing protein [Roseomonas aerilata]